MAALLQHHRLQPAHPILPSVALYPRCVTVPSPADQQGVNFKGSSVGSKIVMYEGFQVTGIVPQAGCQSRRLQPSSDTRQPEDGARWTAL